MNARNPSSTPASALAATESAPGRINLLGEHTDYNEGFVLPTTIPQRTRVELSPRRDDLVEVQSAEVEPGQTRSWRLGDEKPAKRWTDYVQGVTWSLAQEGLRIGGFDAFITSEVPVGAGLSSSAALEVSLLRALRVAFSLPLDDRVLATIAHRAETEFVGVPVGTMDPIACTLGRDGSALFIDTRTLLSEQVAIPVEAELVVIDSGVTPDRVGEYRTRRRECEEAARRMGARSLREVDDPERPEVKDLPEPLRRRARHVISENARVLRAVDALREGDLAELGRLFAASHASMRDDLEVSTPEVDRLVELLAAEPEVYGARLAGAGFGGPVVALARRGEGDEAARRVVERAGAHDRGRPRVLVPPQPDQQAR